MAVTAVMKSLQPLACTLGFMLLPSVTSRPDDTAIRSAQMQQITQDARQQTIRPYTIRAFADRHAPDTLSSRTMASSVAMVMGLPSTDNDLASGIQDYANRQGYKYFEAGAGLNLIDLNVYNQKFLQLGKTDRQKLQDSNLIGKNDYLKRSHNDDLHDAHWVRARACARTGYLDTLGQAVAKQIVTDKTTWQSWHHGLLADTDYLPGAGGNLIELGAFAEQRRGFFVEEHQFFRGVRNGQHIATSKHYAFKYAQTHTAFAQAIDVYVGGPDHEYGRKAHLKLAAFNQELLPHVDRLGVPRVLKDVAFCDALKCDVNPGELIYRGDHLGSHVHISAAPGYATINAGAHGTSVSQAQDRRAARTALFWQNRQLPVEDMEKKILAPLDNIIVLDRNSTIPMDSAYPSIVHVPSIIAAREERYQAKILKIKTEFAQNRKKTQRKLARSPRRAASADRSRHGHRSVQNVPAG